MGNLRSSFKEFVRNRTGYKISKPNHLTNTEFRSVAERLARLCGPIKTVIDIGASDGSWSNSARAYWPRAEYLMVEAQESHRIALQQYATTNINVTVEHAAASDRTGSLYFLDNGSLGGSASHKPFPEHTVELPCIAIDDAIRAHGLSSPFLIKLDTHGHEREILLGAKDALRNCSLIVVEAYTFSNFGRMTFWELCEYLAEHGFRPAGMSDPMVRPSDDLLWQMDLWFLPSKHPSFRDTTWNSRNDAP